MLWGLQIACGTYSTSLWKGWIHDSKIIDEYYRWGLVVSISEIKYVCVRGVWHDPVSDMGQCIQHCKEYKYLGLKVTWDASINKAIK